MADTEFRLAPVSVIAWSPAPVCCQLVAVAALRCCSAVRSVTRCCHFSRLYKPLLAVLTLELWWERVFRSRYYCMHAVPCKCPIRCKPRRALGTLKKKLFVCVCTGSVGDVSICGGIAHVSARFQRLMNGKWWPMTKYL